MRVVECARHVHTAAAPPQGRGRRTVGAYGPDRLQTSTLQGFSGRETKVSGAAPCTLPFSAGLEVGAHGHGARRSASGGLSVGCV